MTRPTERGVTLMEVLVAVTLLSLLSVGILFAMRVGIDAMGRTNNRVIANRRVLGVERILTEQIAGFIPTKAECPTAPNGPRSRVAFFQGEPQTMRFVSSYSLNEGSRGYPQILEFQVIPGEEGVGVRLVVNEWLYTGPLSTGALCLGIAPDPVTRAPLPLLGPVQIGPRSFVLADKLHHCTFAYREQREPPEPDLWLPRWPRDTTPAAVRIDLAPLEPEPGRLQLIPVVGAFRPNRHALAEFSDYSF